MPVKATVTRLFDYTPIGKVPQVISTVIARTEFPQAVELDEDVIQQVEAWYVKSAEVASHEHENNTTIIVYELGTTILINYEVV